MTIQENIKRENETCVMQFKVVYWGPGESGKTTNYIQLLKKYNKNKISKGFQIETTDHRTLWQDSVFLTFHTTILGKNYQFVIQITTCTGQERFLSTREYVLHGADGIIFVADSHPDKMDANYRSFRELLAFISGRNIPFLIQLNKRDLDNAVPVNQFKEIMGLPDSLVDEDEHYIVYPCVAIKGQDVYRIFHDLIEKILIRRFNPNRFMV
ncbi:MAG: hypothetical protein GF364_11510 [Candidatus Lokiarchaeota archaeon]|nr:hypothetical protein [Candidatus Lokiarchaeota archaeon]